jgi:hypothetical protein
MTERNAGNTRQNKRLAKLIGLRDEADDEALRCVMQSEDGRRVVYALAVRFGWLESIWDSNSPRQTDFNAGRQSAAIEITKWAARVAPGEFQIAIGEATQRDKDTAELSKAAVMDTQEHDDE